MYQSPLNLVGDINRASTDNYDINITDEFGQLLKSRTEMKGKQSRDHIHMCYFFSLLLTITIGTVQFGWSIGVWNSGWLFYARSMNIFDTINEDTQIPNYLNERVAVQTQLTVQSVTTGGAMLGALIAGPISKIGRWKSIMFCNLLVIIGNGLQFYWTNYAVFLSGRAIFGIAAGGFSCVCPKYINECSPKEISGPAGAMFQVMVALGIFASLIVTFPFDPVNDPIWRIEMCLYILFSIPIALALIQTLLMITVFSYDTPKELSAKGEATKLRQCLFKMYEPSAVQDVMDSLFQDDYDIQGGASYGEICCNAAYRRATCVGIFLSIFQQLTGINMLMLYSGSILGSLGLTVNSVNALVGGVSLGCAIIGLILLNFLGRKTIMAIGNLIMSLALIGFGLNTLFYEYGHQYIAIACLFTLLAFFQFSSGPIVWLYMAEIMQDKAQSIATVFNWLIILLIAIGTPLLEEWLGLVNFGWVFIFFGGATFIGFLFILIFMKETKGLSPVEIDALFNKQNSLNIKSKDLLKY